MSAMLTLLFVCHEGEDCSHLLGPAPSANDRLLVGSCNQYAKLFSPGEPVDAIVIHQDHLQHGCGVIAEFKRVAPRTPMMLLRGRNQPKTIKPPGIVAVCCADLRDEKLVKSLWTFFRIILGKQVLTGIETHPPPLSKRYS
jgi:hypothetical protein